MSCDKCPTCRLKDMWPLDPPWDPDVMLFGVDPGEDDPLVPRRFDPSDWRAIIDAEGEVLFLARKVGPYGDKGWPEYLAQFLNAATDVIHPLESEIPERCEQCGAERGKA